MICPLSKSPRSLCLIISAAFNVCTVSNYHQPNIKYIPHCDMLIFTEYCNALFCLIHDIVTFDLVLYRLRSKQHNVILHYLAPSINFGCTSLYPDFISLGAYCVLQNKIKILNSHVSVVFTALWTIEINRFLFPSWPHPFTPDILIQTWCEENALDCLF